MNHIVIYYVKSESLLYHPSFFFLLQGWWWGKTTLSRKDECIRFLSILLSGFLPKLGSYYPVLQLYLGLNNIAHTS